MMNSKKLNEQKVQFHSISKQRHFNPTFLSTNISVVLSENNSPKFQSQSFKSPKIISFLPEVKKVEEKVRNPQLVHKKVKIEVMSREVTPARSQQSKYSSLNRRSMSLAELKPHTNDKGIYEKQARKYNIITIEPKSYYDSIRVFPKLRQELKYNQQLNIPMMNKQIAEKYGKFMRMVEAKTSTNKKFITQHNSNRLSFNGTVSE